MKQPNEKVKESIRNYCYGKELDPEKVIQNLKWDSLNRCFYFWDQMVYVGIEEEDGYLHS